MSDGYTRLLDGMDADGIRRLCDLLLRQRAVNGLNGRSWNGEVHLELEDSVVKVLAEKGIEPQAQTYACNPLPLPRDDLPVPVLDDRPDWVDLYWMAWRQAWDHVVTRADFPFSPYLDEAFRPDRIWIWDSCFMVLFARYAYRVFPAANTLDNFYAMILDGVQAPLKIHHPDNPPLFAWAERELFRMTGDTARLRRILVEKRYLQRLFDHFDRFVPGARPEWADCAVALKREKEGYRWSGCPSGMDNTPRGEGDHDGIYWLDALAQQALSARCIATLAGVIGESAVQAEFEARWRSLGDLLNRRYWHEGDRFYYDIRIANPGQHVRVRTPASYWPVLAGVASADQSAAMAAAAEDPDCFGGGPAPFPAVARNSPYYEPKGLYMQSGVWLPMVYLAVKALDGAGHVRTADAAAMRMLDHMARACAEFKPSTIWECYAPESPMPATTKNNRDLARPDFCGWSALGPIALLIENVLGFSAMDAVSRTVHWRRKLTGRHGIENLRFGGVTASLLFEDGTVRTRASAPFSLVLNGVRHEVAQGEGRIG